MTWTVSAVQTITGQNLGPLDCAINSWSRVLNGTEQLEIKLLPDTAGRGTGLTAATRDQYRALTEPARMSLVLEWDGLPIWAGPVWSRQRAADGTVTITAAGMASMFARRKLMTPGQTPYAAQSWAYTGISPATIARRLVAFSLARTGGSLPIVFAQGDEADSNTADARTYAGADCNTIGDVLSALTSQKGGPDVDWRPVWTDATRQHLQWQMVTGTLAQPFITSSNQLTWETGTPQAAVRQVTVTEDASKMVTDQWGRGSGSGTSTLMSWQNSVGQLNLGWPLLEAETDYSDVTAQAELDADVAGDLNAYLAATAQWTLQVDAYSNPQLGSYALGDLPTVHVQGDLWIPDGTYGMRLVGISGDGTNTVSLQVQNASARALDIPGSPDNSLPARIVQLERQVRSTT